MIEEASESVGDDDDETTTEHDEVIASTAADLDFYVDDK